MALDHVRDFYHLGAITYDATNMSTTTPFLFFTRWITHFCAPTFVFLSGVSANIAGFRRSRNELSGYLIKRGLWLILVELAVITFALTLNPFFNILILQVIWAIGASMVLLGLAVRAPISVIGALGLIIFLFHNLLDYLSPQPPGISATVLQIFLTAKGSVIPLDNSHIVLALYAILPWTGVMFLGYATGALFRMEFNAQRRKRLLLISGFTLIATFIVLRLLNSYGDPSTWTIQKDSLFTLMSFLNTSKYPPSLLYLCMTLGPTLIALTLLEGKQFKFLSVFTVFGRVPFFYYVLHFYTIRILNVVFFFAYGYESNQINETNNIFLFRPASFGFDLATVYLIWLLIVAALYYPCKWFGRVKRNNRSEWLSYV